MGGVAGHLAHLYDNKNLTYNQMASILQKAANGELIGTEKTDGYNIYLGFVDGEPRAARNKGDMSRGGMTMQDLANRTFQGGEKAKNAYVKAFEAYARAITSLSNEELANIFGDSGEIFYNAEIQGPVAPNVVNYDENIISIHHMGHKKYNKDANTLEVIGAARQSAFLDSIIDRFEEAIADQDFSVRRTAFLTLNRITDETYLTEILERIQETGYSGDMTINDYLSNKLWPVVDENFVDIDQTKKQQLVNRILKKEDRNGDPEYISLIQIMKGAPRELKTKVSEFVKESKTYIKEFMWPIELAIHDFAVELLRGLESIYVLDNPAEVKRLKGEVDEAIAAIKAYNGPGQEEAHEILAQQLTKLRKHDNIDTVVEGFAFQHEGQMYKFTGNFAPMNQLLGLFKYGRGKIPQMVKESILREKVDENGKEIIAIYPGRFQPMGRHHAEVFKEIQREYGLNNTFLATSNKTDMTLRDGVPISPFDFHEKQMIAAANGIPVEQVVMVKNPYNAVEILDNYDPESTAVKYFVGEKDMEEEPRFQKTSGTTKSGYDWSIATAPHISIDLANIGEMSGTTLRQALSSTDDIKFGNIMGFSAEENMEIFDIIKKKLSTEGSRRQLREETQHNLGIFLGLIENTVNELNDGTMFGTWPVRPGSATGRPGDAGGEFDDDDDDNKLEEEEDLEEISVAGGVAAGQNGDVEGSSSSKIRKRTAHMIENELFTDVLDIFKEMGE